MKAIVLASAALILTLPIGCGRSRIVLQDKNSEPLVPDEGDGYLMFDLQRLEESASRQRYDCSFKTEGKTAHFQFEVVAGAPSGDPPISIASGKIVAVPGSDASVFLGKLQKTLEAKAFPTKVQRVRELSFSAAVLGTRQSHAIDGGFFAKPPGNWTAMKIFIGKEEDPAEVFLNFNSVLRKGEFSIKDADYGDEVLRELAKVL